MLLDSESSVHAFFNDRLVSNIRNITTNMALLTNAGEISTSQIFNVDGIRGDTVWYHPKFISNIMSLGILKKMYHIRL